jgi:hypothetical protein
MNERTYKTIEMVGAGSLVIGIITIVTGVTLGVLTIVNGARLLKKRSDIII